jgi:hypothetical protein
MWTHTVAIHISKEYNVSIFMVNVKVVRSFEMQVSSYEQTSCQSPESYNLDRTGSNHVQLAGSYSSVVVGLDTGILCL